MSDAVYFPVTYGMRLRLDPKRMRQRLGMRAASTGNAFVGGDSFRLWQFKTRVERVACWANERLQRLHPDDVLPHPLMSVSLSDHDLQNPMGGRYWLVFRQDGYLQVPPEHRELVDHLAREHWDHRPLRVADRASAV